MQSSANNAPVSGWAPAVPEWEATARRHPELALSPGKWGFYNFMRKHRDALVSRDAVRLVQGRFWIANRECFSEAVFDAATSGPYQLAARRGRASGMTTASQTSTAGSGCVPVPR